MSEDHVAEPQGLLDALKRVAVTLKRLEVPFALAGSGAVFAHGGTGSTHDVDFVVRESDLESITSALEEAGMTIKEPPEDWLVKAYAGDNLVDLIFRLPEGSVDDEMLARATEMSVESVLMPVLAPTDLIAAKLLTLREHFCDFSPVLSMARSLREKIDWAAVLERTEQSPYAQAFLFLAEKLGLLDGSAADAGSWTAREGADDSLRVEGRGTR